MNSDRDSTPRWYAAALVLALLLGAAVRLYGAAIWRLEFDEPWNMFYAVVEPWDVMWLELKYHAHPPLSMAWIWLCLLIGEPPFAARMASVVPGMVMVGLIHRLARNVSLVSPVPLLLVLALAFSPVWISLSIVVRSYAVMNACLVIAALALTDVVRRPDQATGRRMATFVVASLLAMWTEYAAVLAVLAAALSFPVLAALGLTRWSSLTVHARRHWSWWLLLAAGAAGLIAYLRSDSMPVWQSHAAEFYRQADEGYAAFVWRGLGALAEGLTFLDGIGPGAAALLFSAGVIGIAAIELRKGRDPARAAIVITTLILIAELAVLGSIGSYPFGGHVRHQSVLLPFLFLVFGMGLDWLIQSLSALRFGFAARAGVATAVALFAVPGLVAGFSATREAEQYTSEFAAVRPHLVPGQAIYLSHFTHFGFFLHTMTDRWRGVARPESGTFVYSVGDERREHRVVVDRRTWEPEWPVGAATANRLATVMREEALDAMIVVSWLNGDAIEVAGDSGERESIRTLQANGLTLEPPFRIAGGFAYRLRRSAQPSR